MLKVLREKTKSLHWVLWLIIASFILLIFVEWGGAGYGGGGTMAGAGWAAKVGGEEISTDEFITAYKNTEAFYQGQLGDAYRRGLFFRPEDVLNDLVDQVLLEEAAERLGLEASAAEIAESIRQRPDLQGNDGRFDRGLYDRLLAFNGLTPKEFEQREAERIRVRKLDELIRSGVVVSEEEVRRTWLERNQSASIRYVLVDAGDFTSEVEVDPAELRAWFDERAEDYDAGPGRRIRWARFDRAAAQAQLEDEAQMREYYETNKDLLYTLGPEQRRARQVLIRVPAGAGEEAKEEARARAEEIAGRARAGEDFAALAEEESEDASTRERGGDMGPFYAGTYDPAFDEAVFAADEGEVVGPIETPQGFHVVLVTKGEGSYVRPFEEVRDLVARGLYAAQAATRVREQMETFQGALAEGRDFEAAAAAAGVEASEPTWVVRGPGPEDGPGPTAVQQAFNLEPGTTSDSISAPGGQVVVQVIDTRDSSPRSFEEAREAVEADFRQEKAVDRAAERAAELAAAARAEGLEAAAGDLTLRTAASLRKRGAIPGLGLEPALNAAALETPLQEIGGPVEVAAGAVVFEVTERRDFDQEAFEAEAESIRQELQGARFQTLRRANLQELRARMEGEILLNDAVLEPLRASQNTANPLG